MSDGVEIVDSKAQAAACLLEADALSKILLAIDGLPMERACLVLVRVCADYGFYDEAERFLRGARRCRERADAMTATTRKETP